MYTVNYKIFTSVHRYVPTLLITNIFTSVDKICKLLITYIFTSLDI